VIDVIAGWIAFAVLLVANLRVRNGMLTLVTVAAFGIFMISMTLYTYVHISKTVVFATIGLLMVATLSDVVRFALRLRRARAAR
jgi:CHASE2 domain-containing sensor protein